MKIHNRNVDDYWQNQVNEYRIQDVSIKKFCQVRNLAYGQFSYYLRKDNNRGARTSKKSGRAELPIFLPLKVQDCQQGSNRQELPDAEWLGLFAAGLIRGLR